MQFGLVISIVLHAVIIGWALITIQSQRELRVHEPDPIITSLVTESELTKLKKGARTAKQKEAVVKEAPKADVAKKEAAKPKPVAAAPAPPPPPEPPAPKQQAPDPIAEKLAQPPPPPPAGPAPEERKKLEAMLQEQARLAREKAEAERREKEQRKAEEQRKADEQRKAEERKRAEAERKQAELRKKAAEAKKRREAAARKRREEEKRRREAAAKKQFDAEKIAALLNKVPNRSAPAPSAPPTEPTKAKGPALGAPEGKDSQISASELALIRSMISSRLRACWRLPSGGGGSDTPVVTLRWHLKPDGSLDGDPEVKQPRGDALFRIAAEAAMRAVRECSPFDLPPNRYGTWRTITWEFDPSQMM